MMSLSPARLPAVLPLAVLLAGCATSAGHAPPSAPPSRPPNLVFILADDLGYGELGAYGQKDILTPRLDRMAAEGMKFRQFYAGATVCAPSRAVLMTGKHNGRNAIRGNAGADTQTLGRGEMTVARLLQQAGYATGLVGKWGLGDVGNTGHPNAQGFDFFYGYLNQVHAHNYYPEFLWRNGTREELGNVVEKSPQAYGSFVGGHATKKVVYSHDLFAEEALAFIDGHRDRPFFLYLALTAPHANNEATAMVGNGQEVPDLGPYTGKDWPEPAKGQAAMITRLDADVGRILDRIDELGLGRDTVVMFSSDNGPHREGGFDPARFLPAGPLRGMKRNLYEGGIRVPLIVRWTGHTPAGSVSDHVGYQGDLMATAAELAGVAPPADRHSVSLLPTLDGRPQEQAQHAYLYWEFYENAGAQAVRMGHWKAVRVPFGRGAVELYDLSKDLGEAHNVAGEHPDVVAKAEALMTAAHHPDPNWTVAGSVKEPPAPGHGQAPF